MTGQLRCENGEWKTRDQFSNNQLLKYDQQVRKGRATAAKSGIRCLEHSSKQALELKCNGPCNRWRGLQFFSKSTRRNGKNVSLQLEIWLRVRISELPLTPCSGASTAPIGSSRQRTAKLCRRPGPSFRWTNSLPDCLTRPT
jgi:hypothetical protein